MDFSIMRQFLRALICYLAKAEQISDITVVVQLHLQKIILCTTFELLLSLVIGWTMVWRVRSSTLALSEFIVISVCVLLQASTIRFKAGLEMSREPNLDLR